MTVSAESLEGLSGLVVQDNLFIDLSDVSVLLPYDTCLQISQVLTWWLKAPRES